jgi:hypothetical protein
MTMRDREMRKLISILMESPLYMTLSLSERQSLLERLTQSYPHFDDENEAGKEDDFE